MNASEIYTVLEGFSMVMLILLMVNLV
jgi:hypothetical protein